MASVLLTHIMKLASFSRIASVVVTLVASLLALAYNTPKGQNFINGFLDSGLQSIPGSGDNTIAAVKEVNIFKFDGPIFGGGASEENGKKSEGKAKNPPAEVQPETKTPKAPEKKAEQKPAEKPTVKAASTDREKLLPSDPGNDQPDETGATVLQRAARNGKLNIVQEKINDGSNVNYVKRDSQFTALLFAAEEGHTDIAKLLIESGADVNAQASSRYNNWTPLFYAIDKNNVDIVKLLLDASPEKVVHHIGGDGNSPLTLATRRKEVNVGIVKALLDAGADTKHADKKGYTPLHHAARNSPEAVQALLEKGADPNVLNEDKWSPIDLAVENRQKKAINALLDAKPDLNIGSISVMELALTRYEDGDAPYWNGAIKRLIDGGADANAIVQKDRSCIWPGSTILMSAVACARIEVAQLLIEGGADVNKIADSGKFSGLNALHVADERRGNLDRERNKAAAAQLVEMLQAAGARY